jgi:hypothetical protein
MRATGCFRTWTLAGLLLLSPTLASAEDAAKPYPPCDRTPTDGDTTAAKGAFQAGNGSFNEADYDRAINYWEDAYRRDCTAHPLLLNLARAYELNGQKQHAITALQTFLVRMPGNSEEEQIKRRIDKLQEQIHAEASAAAPPPTTATPAPTSAAPPPPAETTPPSEAPPPTGKRPIEPLILAGGGAAVAIISGIIYAGAQSDLKTFDQRCPGRVNCLPSVAADGNSAKKRADVSGGLAIVGLAAAVGGTVWYFVSKPKPAATASHGNGVTAAVSPALGFGYGGVQFDGAF